MNTYTTTTEAIDRSISHNEISRATVPHALFAVAQIISSGRYEDVDYGEVDVDYFEDSEPAYLDVWGRSDGAEWRIHLVSAEPEPAAGEDADVTADNDGPGWRLELIQNGTELYTRAYPSQAAAHAAAYYAWVQNRRHPDFTSGGDNRARWGVYYSYGPESGSVSDSAYLIADAR